MTRWDFFFAMRTFRNWRQKNPGWIVTILAMLVMAIGPFFLSSYAVRDLPPPKSLDRIEFWQDLMSKVPETPPVDRVEFAIHVMDYEAGITTRSLIGSLADCAAIAQRAAEDWMAGEAERSVECYERRELVLSWIIGDGVGTWWARGSRPVTHTQPVLPTRRTRT